MADAGERSPHLDEAEQQQASEGAQLGPMVIHEIVREEGEEELARSNASLAWSGFAAGSSIGFSFLLESAMQAALPDTSWRRLVAGFGYSAGFLITVLGRQQLFTETTLTALIPALTKRDRTTMLGTLRVWGVVLLFNLLATWIFGFLAARIPMFEPATVDAMRELATKAISVTLWPGIAQGAAAGWLIGLMVWLLPPSGGARPFVIVALTWIVAVFQFPHIVAGSVEAAYAVASGIRPPFAYVVNFLVPVLIGNVLGGTVLVGLLNHAPVIERMRGR